MTTNVVSFTKSRGGGGGGPDDPVLEERVARLELILARLEPKITELLLVGAKQADLQNIRADLAELKGRFSGLEARIAALPSVWMILTIILTTWAIGSGILISAITILRH